MAAQNELERVKILMDAVALFSGHLLENQGDHVMEHIFKSLGVELPEPEDPAEMQFTSEAIVDVEGEVVDA